jgi:hypothetical protein
MIILVAVGKRGCPLFARLMGSKGADDVVTPVSSWVTNYLDAVLVQDIE